MALYQGELFGIRGDWSSSSSSSLASSSSDEDRKMNKKLHQGRARKYVADVVPNYVNIVSAPYFRKRGRTQEETKCIPPPPYPMDFGQAQAPWNLPQGVGMIDIQTVREALGDFVSDHCCYGSGPVQEMELKNIRLMNVLHYVLETYTEDRKVKWRSHMYVHGDHVDHPSYGPAPMPWEVDVGQYTSFNDEKRKLPIPRTSSVKKCWYCKGKGKVRCRKCKGCGTETCTSCSSSGRDSNDQPCTWCSGTGRKSCIRCSGNRRYKCRVCSGAKRLKWYIELTSKTKTQKAERVQENAGVPDALITQVSGLRVYEDVQYLVRPLQNFPVPVINEWSHEIVNNAIRAYPDSKYLMQRQSVNIIPVSEVDWKWKESYGSFFVFGIDNRVYFPDYPKKCCCSVL